MPQSGSSVLGVLADLAEAVHDPEALEGVLAVEEAAVVDLAQVALHVGAGEGGAAEQHRDVAQLAGVELLEVVAHDQGALDQQAAHADGVGLDLEGLLDHLGDRDLDPDVVDLVAVVGEDDVDEVLADVVHVALDGGEHDAALAGVDAVGHLLHVGLEVGDRGLHGLGRLEHERELHLAGAEQLAHHLHAAEQVLVDDLEGGDALGQGLVEVGGEAVALAVDDAVVEALADRPVGAVLLLDLGCTFTSAKTSRNLASGS